MPEAVPTVYYAGSAAARGCAGKGVQPCQTWPKVEENRAAPLKGGTVADTRIGPVLTAALVGSALALLGIAWEARQVSHLARVIAMPDHALPAPRVADATAGGGPPGGDVFSIAIDPQTPATVYAVAGDNVYKSVDGGGSWRSVTRLPNHNLPAITVDPANPSRLFVPVRGRIVRTTNGGASWHSLESETPRAGATARLLYARESSGVHQSRDGGETWRDLAQRGDLRFSVVSTFASDARHPLVLYVGLYSNGILKSVDGGESWTRAERGLPIDTVKAIAVDPSNPAIVYAGLAHAGVFRTRDGGGDWTEVGLGLGNKSVSSLAIDPSRPSVIYAGTDEGVFKSVDAAAAWTATGRGFRATTVYSLAIDPARPDVLYAGLNGRGVFKSVNGGKTWFPARSGLAAAWITRLAPGPGDASLYAATEEEVFAYRRGRWSSIASRENLGGDSISAFAADLANPGTVYVGAKDRQTARRGHVYRSSDGGAHWSAVLDANWVTDLAVGPLDGVLWAAGWIGLHASRDSGATWTDVRWKGTSLAGYNPVIDPIHPATLYALPSRESLLKSTDRGTTWSVAAKGLPTEYERWEGISSLVIDPTNPDVLYASQAYDHSTDRHPLYRSTDGGVSWTAWGPWLPRPGLLLVAIDPGNPRSLLGATGAGLSRSIDGGITWSRVGAGLPGHMSVRAIAFDPTRPGTVYASGQEGVFVSADGGITWRPTESR